MSRDDAADNASAWMPVDRLPALTPEVLAELLDGGQAFRWYQSGGDAASPPRLASTAAAGAATHSAQPRGDSPIMPVRSTCWTGVWSDNVASVRLAPTGMLEWSAPAAIASRVGPALRTYLGGAADFAAATDALPWRSDPHLAACLSAFPGLRILRQPFGETLLGFLCSATKQIVQIKQMVALLAERHGRPIGPMWAGCPQPASLVGTRERDRSTEEFAAVAGPRSRAPSGARAPRPHLETRRTINALPTWDDLAGISETELRQCLLGFRAKYIAQTAQFLARHPGWLEETESLPYAAAKERLCSLPGVGEKVADCVLLFGAGRLEAFPVDVWILKTMAKRYHLHGWKPAQVAQFGRVHFGPHAGLAQQFLFAWERQQARRTTK